jgi:lysophospholipase L1-like esterase
MKYLSLLIVALLLLAGCRQTGQIKDETVNSKLTYLALGDSYTIGEGVEAADRWPVQLSSSLTQLGYTTWSPLIVAQTGWTTDELMDGINAASIDMKYDLVSLLIGVNNQYRGRDSAEFRTEFKELLSRALAFAGDNASGVVVLSIPDWGVTPFAEGRDREKIAAEIDAFNAIKKEETEKKGILFVDITGISRLAGGDSTLLAPDGLHPSGKMYGLWVDQVIPLLNERLESK